MADREEESLRLASGMQDANSILLARQHAEQALSETKTLLDAKSRELAQSRALFRATLEATNDAILVMDVIGKVADANERFVEMWRIPQGILAKPERQQLLAQMAQQVVDQAAFLTRVDEIERTTQESFDELRLTNGRIVERFSKIQCVDERPVGRVWSFRDVTEQKRFDESQARLAAVVQYSDDAIVSKTLTGIITTWNLAAERMFGYTAAEAIGKPVLMLIPPDRKEEETVILGRLNRGEHIDHYETIRVRKDGTRIHVSLTVSPVKDHTGKIIGASKIARDITESKRAEEALRRSEAELRAIAAEREALLEAERAARNEAERVSMMKDEFLATLSHELRTPLSAILGWSHLLSSGNVEEEDLRQGLDAIQRNARAQTQLIEDLLDMSRIISGKIRLDVQWTDLASVVQAALESVRPSAEAKNIRLRKVLDPHAGPVMGDPTRLQQVVWNLLSNAIKFTPKGGRVDVYLERVNSHLEITVHDTGIGIKPEFLPMVFERFRQADSSTTRSYGGLGLGLSIVKNLVELHGGTTRAKSAGEGHGATFMVSLPLAPVLSGDRRQHPTSSHNSSAVTARIDLSGVQVLIVDDEPDARALISRVLTQCNATVSTAGSAAEGLSKLQEHQPHVIVSDIGMPETDGYEFIRSIRRLPAEDGGRTPAIALTAFARSEDRTRAMIAGYQVHIAKPIEPQELAATVASLAGRMGVEGD